MFRCNVPSQKEAKNHERFRKQDWDKNGIWQGKCTTGWDGISLLGDLEKERKVKEDDGKYEEFRLFLHEKLDAMKTNGSPAANRNILKVYVNVLYSYWHSKALSSVC